MSSSAAANKVSFTIRRPTPASREASSGADSDGGFKVPALPRHLTNGASTPGSPLARSTAPSPSPARRTYTERDSSDEDSAAEDELVTGFDQFGVQRVFEKPKPQGPLVIPALKNRDWREQARKRKALYIPPTAAATGADGSVGGLGTRDTINSGPQLSGLQVTKRARHEEDGDEQEQAMPMDEPPAADAEPAKEETEDEKALRAVLASAADPSSEEAVIAAIPIAPVTEDDAYKQDVLELPDPATLDDYERVPVSQFGAALLRGMGWKEGTAASRKNKGLIEPWLPQSRPALLGIGAKEKEVFDDGSKGKKKTRPDKKYIPVVKRERERPDGERGSGSGGSTPASRQPSLEASRRSSRRSSRSPSPDRDRRRDRDRRNGEYERDRDGERDRQRDKERDREREGDNDRDRRRDDRRDDRRDHDSSRRDRDRERDRDGRRDRSRDRHDSDSRRRDRY
ncbi:hypothetical protein CERSUDRAFT_75130 [Gelatoporia subvermispora B]|uniref:G-patch domain-containing protein n=1 Tax=Ceriporiopsis subvermispora (strain B) TaxID=914234 RepID=M2QU07_CERS8|nr:hypothetical protein CERSUDRAFT_75130 [Gelatoporia subvermispora B]